MRLHKISNNCSIHQAINWNNVELPVAYARWHYQNTCAVDRPLNYFWYYIFMGVTRLPQQTVIYGKEGQTQRPNITDNAINIDTAEDVSVPPEIMFIANAACFVGFPYCNIEYTEYDTSNMPEVLLNVFLVGVCDLTRYIYLYHLRLPHCHSG